MERRLVERAMHGDEEAFDLLVDRIGDSLHSVARRILRDTTLAQDATQQALLDAWRNLPRLRDPDRFEAWTYRLLVNACHAESRRERHQSGNLRLLPNDEPTVTDSASQVANREQLDHAFRRLSVEHRTVVVLVHYLGFTHAEAAESMGTPVGYGPFAAPLRIAVHARGHRGRGTGSCFNARHGMTREDEFIGQLEAYLDDYEGFTPLPDTVRDAVRAELPKTKQIGSRWPPMTFLNLTMGVHPATKYGLLAAVVMAVAVLGVVFVYRGSNVGGPDATPTPRPPGMGTPGSELDAGTYTLVGDNLDATITVPAGWTSIESRGAVTGDDDTFMGVVFWPFPMDLEKVYTDPCNWAGAEIDPAGWANGGRPGERAGRPVDARGSGPRPT